MKGKQGITYMQKGQPKTQQVKEKYPFRCTSISFFGSARFRISEVLSYIKLGGPLLKI